MNKIKLICLTLITSILLISCNNEKNKLDNRVQDYWNYKIAHDFSKAYEFLSPGWKANEKVESFQRRMAMSSVKWINARVIEKKCSQTYLCEVKVGIEYEYRFKRAMNKVMKLETSLKENWIMKNNIWYNIPITKQKL